MCPSSLDTRCLSDDIYPSIDRATRLLIVDYDITRYHSFDLFRCLLLDKSFFMDLKPKYHGFIAKDISLIDRVDFMRKNINDINVFNCFNSDIGIDSIEKLEDQLNVMMSKSDVITPTNLHVNLDVTLANSTVNGWILRYKQDPHKPVYIDNMKVYEFDHILNTDLISAIIIKNGINAVFISSIELAVLLMASLSKQNYNEPISFMIGGYAYNYYNINGIEFPKYIDELRSFEYACHHEYGFFDPYSTITYRKRIDRFLEEDVK